VGGNYIEIGDANELEESKDLMCFDNAELPMLTRKLIFTEAQR
jgi:hypothetical protein